MSSSQSNHFSREFFDLVKAIGECRSKQEEDRIVEAEMASLKARFQDVSNLQNAKKMKEFLVRAIYVEMLGHDASALAYIHGVNLCHNKDLGAKRVGYLVSCLFLDPNASELMILLINTIHKDLKSSNFLEISFALVTISRLANLEMVPALLAQVSLLLEHPNEMIRRRAVAAFHRLVQVGGEISAQQIHIATRKSLSDSDPGVMAVGLNLLQDLVVISRDACDDLVPSLVLILKQVIEHKLPKEFEYHRMPAPWVQMRLVSILGVLGKNNSKNSELMYEILQETMRRADVGSNVGAAVAAECIKCATTIVPNHTLLEFSSLLVSKFILSDNHNFKYLGVTSLGLLARVKTAYASEHQLRVVECLEDSDETLRRKTIDLLSTMTNPANVAVVVEKLLSQLLQEDVCFKSDLVNRVCPLSERFAPSNEWYLVTINQVFFLAGLDAPLPASVGDNLTRLVAEQDGADPVTGNDLREVAANEYVVWIEKFLAATGQSTMISNQFLKLAVWMVGEFATLCSLEGYAHLDDVIDLLIDAAAKIQSESVLGCIVSAVSKLSVSASDDAKSAIRAFFHNIKSKWPLSAEIDDRCCQSLYILNQPLQVQRLVLPFDAACEDLDINLSFLDAFCAAARQKGAKEYSKRPTQKPHKPHIENSSLKGLRFEAYLPPQPVVSKPPSFLSPPVSSRPSSPAAQPLASPPTSAAASIQLSVPGAPKRWGPPSAAAKIPPKAPPVSSQSILPKPEIISVPPTVQNLEKQRMAAALFSGVVGASPSLPYASRPKSAHAIRVTSSVSDIDLLDLKVSATAPPPASSPDADLLDL